MRIGIDFDNTLVSYEQAFAQVALEEGLLPRSFAGGKTDVKTLLLDSPSHGLPAWERLQGLVYGRQIGRAQLFDGVAEFFRLCRDRPGTDVYIVSHKTELAHHDPLLTNLRQAALAWMEGQGFFDANGFGLKRENLFFEATREDKVRRIVALACDVFIDDLPEVLGHAAMPAACRKILFRGTGADSFEHAESWHAIATAVFAHTRTGT